MREMCSRREQLNGEIQNFSSILFALGVSNSRSFEVYLNLYNYLINGGIAAIDRTYPSLKPNQELK
jgi:hypothetical protein